MVKHSFCLLSLLFLAIAASSPTFAHDAPSPTPFFYDGFSFAFAPGADVLHVEDDDSPVPPPEYLDFLDSCTDKIKAECGKEVFNYMFVTTEVTKECCKNILEAGMECHVELVRTIFSLNQLKLGAVFGIPRSKEIWNKCVKEVGAEMGAPVPLET